jgi:hypothetical protein
MAAPSPNRTPKSFGCQNLHVLSSLNCEAAFRSLPNLSEHRLLLDLPSPVKKPVSRAAARSFFFGLHLLANIEQGGATAFRHHGQFHWPVDEPQTSAAWEWIPEVAQPLFAVPPAQSHTMSSE